MSKRYTPQLNLTMPQLPNITPKQLVRFFEQQGFELDHTTGSHQVFYQENSKRRAVIPMHTKDLPRGTLLAILRQSAFTKSDLVDWLRK